MAGRVSRHTIKGLMRAELLCGCVVTTYLGIYLFSAETTLFNLNPDTQRVM